MQLSVIKTEAEYVAALKEVEWLFEIDDNTFDAEQMENILYLLEAYEDKHYPIPKPNLSNRISNDLESRGFLRR